MRAGLDMFADVLPVRAGRLRAELGWLAACSAKCGPRHPARRFDDWTEEMPGDHREALDELADLLAGHRMQSRRALLEALDSRRYERLVSAWWRCSNRVPPAAQSRRMPAVTAMPA